MSDTILFYCEQYFGTGHIVRTINIAQAILRNKPSSEIHIIFGGELNSTVVIPEGIVFHQLETHIADKDMIAPETIDTEIANERRTQRFKEIQNFLISFTRLDHVFVGMYPYTRQPLRKQYDFFLHTLKSIFPESKVYSYIRDIEGTLSEGEANFAFNSLSQYFDAVFVCGNRENYDILSRSPLLRWLQGKFLYSGYVVPQLPENELKLIREKSVNTDKIKCVVSVGAGQDGFDIQKKIVECLIADITLADRLHVDMFLSDYYSEEECNILEDICSGTLIKLHDMSNKFKSYLAESNIHICMGGYNSIAESMQSKSFPIIVPRELNQEQKLRGRVLERHGMAYVIEQDELNSEALSFGIKSVFGILENYTDTNDLNGASFIANKIFQEELFSEDEKLDLLSNLVWLSMSIKVLEYPAAFYRCWLTACSFAKNLEWNESMLDKFFQGISMEETFPRALILPETEFNKVTSRISKEYSHYDVARPFSHQVFEQLYFHRKTNCGAFIKFLSDTKDNLNTDAFLTITSIKKSFRT